MLGAIIGDIVGSRWEFMPTNDYNFEWLSERNDITDDTICTIAIADALLKNKDYGESLHEWCSHYPFPKGGYGNSFARWVFSNNPRPYNSFGNGAAMRVSPVAHWFYSEEHVLDTAAATAMPTHNHEEGIRGAKTVALCIFLAKKAYKEGEILNADQIHSILNKCIEFSGYNINIEKEDVLNKFDVTCQGTVPVALGIIGESSSFEDAIRKAVSLGADADTLGAIVGSIAEVIWGIPHDIKQEIMDCLPEEMKQVVCRFYESLKNRIE